MKKRTKKIKEDTKRILGQFLDDEYINEIADDLTIYILECLIAYNKELIDSLSEKKENIEKEYLKEITK